MKNLKERIEMLPNSDVYTEEEMVDIINFICKPHDKRIPMFAVSELAGLITAIGDFESRPGMKDSNGYIDIIDELADIKLIIMALQYRYGIHDKLLNKACTLKLFDAKQKAYAEEMRQKEWHKQLLLHTDEKEN